jgi:hypothetical protein
MERRVSDEEEDRQANRESSWMKLQEGWPGHELDLRWVATSS